MWSAAPHRVCTAGRCWQRARRRFHSQCCRLGTILRSASLATWKGEGWYRYEQAQSGCLSRLASRGSPGTCLGLTRRPASHQIWRVSHSACHVSGWSHSLVNCSSLVFCWETTAGTTSWSWETASNSQSSRPASKPQCCLRARKLSTSHFILQT